MTSASVKTTDSRRTREDPGSGGTGSREYRKRHALEVGRGTKSGRGHLLRRPRHEGQGPAGWFPREGPGWRVPDPKDRVGPCHLRPKVGVGGVGWPQQQGTGNKTPVLAHESLTILGHVSSLTLPLTLCPQTSTLASWTFFSLGFKVIEAPAFRSG